MKNWLRVAILTAAVLIPNIAHAGLITAGGEWSPMGPASNNGPRWFDNDSWDGEQRGIGWMLQSGTWEYFHRAGDPNSPESFGWTGEAEGWSSALGITAYVDGHANRNVVTGEITWTSTGGGTISSWAWGGALLVRALVDRTWMYLAAFEDISQNALKRECGLNGSPQRPWFCGDFNDGEAKWTLRLPTDEGGGGNGGGTGGGGGNGGGGGDSIPEPSAMMLALTAAVGFAARRRRR